MIVMYDNLINEDNADLTSITANSEDPYYPVETAFFDPRLSRTFRSISASAVEITFTFDQAVNADYFIMAAHNLSSGATVSIQADSSATFTPDYSATVTIDGDIGYADFAATKTYRYWKLVISEPVPGDYIEIGGVFLGLKAVMPGFSPEGSIFKKSNSSASFSLSGQAYGQRRIRYKVAEIAFNSISATEKTTVETFTEYVDVDTPFYLLLWENDPDVEPPVYCIFEEYPEVVKTANEGLVYKTTFKIREVF